MRQSRYLIGIDLGTTNCALSFVDTLAEKPNTRVLPIIQLRSPGQLEERPGLASCCYVAAPDERKRRVLAAPIEGAELPADTAVGSYALTQLGTAPGRVIQSAKSWLCHGGVDRAAPILPWGSEEVDSEHKLSPVEVSARYLRQMAAAWNASLGMHQDEYRFEHQDVTITVPASFDEAAQRLTLDAAAAAGCPEGVRLIEEPQAAFYRWLELHALSRDLAPHFESSEVSILVCDIGGGTTDFSLFRVSLTASADIPEIERIAVSDHLLLGGDNIDLTIAVALEARLGAPDKLSPKQWAHLVFQARQLKERVLQERGTAAEEECFVSVPGRGSGLFASALTASIRRGEIEALLLDGFFPVCRSDAYPPARAGGLREWGLPFVSDTAVTHHLAAFLRGRRVDAVLFNGGSLKPAFLRSRLIEVLGGWQEGRAPIELENPEMESAVARGAARYGWVLRTRTGRIRGGYPRSLYLELHRERQDPAPKVVCVLPKRFEEGHELSIASPSFMLLLDQPARFQLFNSSVRPDDLPGQVLPLTRDDFHSLPPLQTMLAIPSGMQRPAGGLLKVILKAALSTTGMFELYCVNAEEPQYRWRLEFQLRGGIPLGEEGGLGEEGAPLGVSNQQLQRSLEAIYALYGKGRKESSGPEANPRGLVKALEGSLARPRSEWELPLLRALWPALAKGITRRSRSLAHETTWLNLAGYCLRPGYGAALDPFRMMELWRVFELGLAFPKEGSALVQWWVMWRRVAGGLGREQQNALMAEILRQVNSQSGDNAEMVRLASSLERVDVHERERIGDLIVKRLLRKHLPAQDQFCWALGRLASRVPLYGELHCVISPAKAGEWFEKLAVLAWDGQYQLLNGAFAQACRVTDDRARDLSREVRERVAKKMKESGASPAHVRVVREHVLFDTADRTALFGEALPSGLRLAEEG